MSIRREASSGKRLKPNATEPRDRYVIEFDPTEVGRFGASVAIDWSNRKPNAKLYLYESSHGQVTVGGSDKKALSFSNAYLAVVYLSRNAISRALRPLARIERKRVRNE